MGHTTLLRASLSAAMLLLLFPSNICAQTELSEQVQVGPPPIPRAYPPPASASADELELRGDDLRAQKAYVEAIDYYRAALLKKSNNAPVYNKIGISELLIQRYAEAGVDFQRAIRADHQYADAYNNLGVINYVGRRYKAAIKLYNKALELRPDAASYFSNLGAVYFSRKEYDKANEAYVKALQLDPDIFERTSHNGIAAQMSAPGDRARYYYSIAKLYAKMGASDRSLQYLRRAMEEGYKGIEDVYKDAEFTDLRKDPRFSQLMAARPLAIPE